MNPWDFRHGGAVMRYEELEHTADLRLKVYGADERELFANAAFALFDTLADLSGVREEVTDEVAAEGADLEETLVNFLGELLYRFDGEGRVYRSCRVVELDSRHVRAALSGEPFEAARHEAKTAIKAVTFHDVQISRGGDGLSVVITCDT